MSSSTTVRLFSVGRCGIPSPSFSFSSTPQTTNPGGGGVRLGILGGVVPPGSPNPLFQTKNCHFYTRFQTRWPLDGNYVIIAFFKDFEFAYFSFFLSYSFGIETIKTFIHSYSSFQNNTRFQTKLGEVYTRFQAKKA